MVDIETFRLMARLQPECIDQIMLDECLNQICASLGNVARLLVNRPADAGLRHGVTVLIENTSLSCR